jgi:SAM-dependent methyltransferase
MVKTKPKLKAVTPLKLDIGCGKSKQEGYHGVDAMKLPGVDTVMDIRTTPWPWTDVDEVRCSHFVEHLTGAERVAFFNELYRVMKPGAKALIVTPDWSHACAYGDPTHQWPPMSGWWPLYLKKEWREGNAPHVGYTCDFDFVIGGSWDEYLSVKAMEFKMFAMQHYTNSQRDLIVTLTKL